MLLNRTSLAGVTRRILSSTSLSTNPVDQREIRPAAGHGRGDAEPLVGLAVRLRPLGANVRVCVSPDDNNTRMVVTPASAGPGCAQRGASGSGSGTAPSVLSLRQRRGPSVSGAKRPGCTTPSGSWRPACEEISIVEVDPPPDHRDLM